MTIKPIVKHKKIEFFRFFQLLLSPFIRNYNSSTVTWDHIIFTNSALWAELVQQSRCSCVVVFLTLSPSHAIFLGLALAHWSHDQVKASHWPSDHMISSRPLIGQHWSTLPLQICIGPTPRIGQESWCLLCAGFFLKFS